MKQNINTGFLFVALVSVLMLLPFIGLTEFNTKGEPREAVVAFTMLKDGNWILPVNNGGDIAYKPPFFHWCIALFSLLAGGVNEYTSRLPSALALIFMTLGVYVFYARRRGTLEGVLTALFTLTAFEVHRAGTNCRVDMVLTAFIVGAMLLLYRWWERGARGLPWMAVLCMSGATLTKGPVGIVLPLLVMFVLMLVRGARFWPTVGKMALTGVLACVLPAVWYVAAYQEGGDAFLQLVKEENLDRFTGKMSYESHVEPFYYNFITLIAGWLPWTVLLVAAVGLVPWRRLKGRFARLRSMQPVELFTWLAFLLVLFFYCIPKSKRSVYLLPVYPFMAWLIARFVMYFHHKTLVPAKVFCWFMGVVGVLMAFIGVALQCGDVPAGLFHGRHAAQNMAMAASLAQGGVWSVQFWLLLLPVVCMAVMVVRLVKSKGRAYRERLLQMMFVSVLALYVALDGSVLPRVLTTKSDRPLALTIDRRYPHDKLYSYLHVDMLHFYCTNFYLGDRIGQFELSRPRSGVLMIAAQDRAEFFARHGARYRFTYDANTRSRMTEMKDTIYFYRFQRK